MKSAKGTVPRHPSSRGGYKVTDPPAYSPHPNIRWYDEFRHVYTPAPKDQGKYDLKVVNHKDGEVLATSWAKGAHVRFTASPDFIAVFKYEIEFRDAVWGRARAILPPKESLKHQTPGVILSKQTNEPRLQPESIALAAFYNKIIAHTVRCFGLSRYAASKDQEVVCHPLPVKDLRFPLKRLAYNRRMILAGVNISPVSDLDKEVCDTGEVESVAIAECGKKIIQIQPPIDTPSNIRGFFLVHNAEFSRHSDMHKINEELVVLKSSHEKCQLALSSIEMQIIPFDPHFGLSHHLQVIQKVRSLLSDAQALQDSMTALKVFLRHVRGLNSPATRGPNVPKIEDWLEACVPWLKAIRDFVALLEAGLPSTTTEAAESHPEDQPEPGEDDEDEDEVDEYLRGEDDAPPRKRVKTRSMSDEDRATFDRTPEPATSKSAKTPARPLRELSRTARIQGAPSPEPRLGHRSPQPSFGRSSPSLSSEEAPTRSTSRADSPSDTLDGVALSTISEDDRETW